MSGSLALLQNYLSDSDEELNIPKKCRVIDVTQKLRLPLPQIIKVNKSSDIVPDWIDNSEEHQGRRRSFEHERGNWASFVFVTFPAEDLDFELLNDFTTTLSSVCEFNKVNNLHISLSKTFVLKFHWISTIKESFQEKIQNTPRFDVILESVAVYSNEEKTRTFIGLKASDYSSIFLKSLVTKVDAVLNEFNLPIFYEDPSFHMSILWCLGYRVQEVNGLLNKLQNHLERFLLLESYPQTSVAGVNLKTGNKPEMSNMNHFIPIATNSVQNSTTRIFVNPNFPRTNPHINRNFTQIPSKCDIHVNPHFNHKGNLKKFTDINTTSKDFDNTNVKSSGIHINPKLLTIAKKQMSELMIQKQIENSNLSQHILDSANPDKYIIKTKNKIVKNNNEITSPSKNIKGSNPLVNSRFKLIRKNSKTFDRSVTSANQNLLKPSPNISVSTSRFRLVRTTVDKSSQLRQYLLQKTNMYNKKADYIKSRVAVNKPYIHSKNKVWKKTSDSSSMTSTRFGLQKHIVSHDIPKVANKRLVPKLLSKRSTSVVFIKGEKYIINSKMLTKIAPEKTHSKLSKFTKQRRVSIAGVTYIQRSANVFVVDNRKRNRLLKLKKTNIPCPTFRRFGVCKKQETGRCSLLHDIKQIAICQTFLKGLCKIDGCNLSHSVSLEKMPTCRFFLKGCCVKENCPYLHVKLNEKADICTDFIKGYCDKGKNCVKKHVYMCPNIQKIGKCDNSKCPYPHKKKLNLKVKSKKVDSIKLVKVCQIETPSGTRDSIDVSLNDDCNSILSRYFTSNANISKNPQINTSNSDIDTNDICLNSNMFNNEIDTSVRSETKELKFEDDNKETSENDFSDESSNFITRRPKLGILPAYISLN